MAEKEYIERGKAIDACFDGWNNNAHDCAENIRAIPADDVRPVVRAKWDDKPVAFFFKCTKCGCCVGHRYDVFLDRGELNFCPNCGADMREES